MTRKPFDFDKRKSSLGLAGKVKKNWKEQEHKVEELGELGFVKSIAEKISEIVKQEVTVEEKKNKRDNSIYYTLEWKASSYLKNHVDVRVKDTIMKAHVEIFYQTDSLRRQGNYYQAKFNIAYHGSSDLPVNSEGISAILHQIEELYKKYNISSVDESYNLGLANKTRSKFNQSAEDAAEDIGNIEIHFEDPHVENAFNLRGLYTLKDIRKVSDIDVWLAYTPVKTFNELKLLSGIKGLHKTFLFCDSLESVELPPSTKYLFKTFRSCKKLKRVILNDGLKEIGLSTFEGCESLEKIDIPDTVTTIGPLAFNNCVNLREINIPHSLKVFSEDDNPFSGCKNLQIIRFCPDINRDLLDLIKRALLDDDIDNVLFVENDEYQEIKESSTIEKQSGLVANKFKNHSNLGLNNKVKKKFDKADAIDNISNFVDLGLPSGKLWCKYNYGANEESDPGEYLNQEEALDLLRFKEEKIPSKEDFEELCSHCDYKFIKVNNVNGMEFYSLSNGNSIFFPAAGGYFFASLLYKNDQGIYWSSTSHGNYNGYELYFNSYEEVDSSAYNYKEHRLPIKTVINKY